MNRQTSQLVVPAWLRFVLGSEVGGVATELPEDNSTWGASGFVVVTVVGGDEDPYLPQGEPVCQLDVYAASPQTGLPLWWVAGNICGAIINAVRPRLPDGTPNPYLHQQLTLSVNGKSYGKARVMEAGGRVLTAPQKIYSDQAQYAHLTMDVDFKWTVIP